MTILLTGATGKTGGAAAKALASKMGAAKGGLKLRALVRNAEKAQALKDLGIELVVGDIADNAVLEKAFAGVDKALLLLPNSQKQLELEKNFTDLAKKAGVKHIVKVSSMESVPGATASIPATHVASENHIRASGLAWTMVRPNFFMQNLLGNGRTIKEMGKFFLPCGNGCTAMSDTRDIGAVIAEVLSGTGHEGKSYDVTGPQVLTFAQAAEIIGSVIGKKVEYVDQPMAEYRAMLGKFITNEWHLNAVCQLFAEIGEGGLNKTTDTVKKLLGREPASLEQFVREHIAVFK
ncbi:MAG: SDR family oxidoreductase [Rhodospirillaceae bacterium]|nr:SDR family oxidoreductase [Rhodospirillaceae bacterium]